MKTLHRTRLAVAVLALTSLGVGSVAQADPFVGRLIGSVAASMLVGGAIKSHDKKFATQCRLYDREGMEVYLPCDSRRPLGEVLTAERPDLMADGLAGGPPVDAAPSDAYAPPVYAPAPMADYAPPPMLYAPLVEADCGCEHGGHTQTSYGAGRVVGVYDAYAESSSSGAVSYSESYGHEGYSDGYYPYGGVGYGAGGYAGYDDGRARVAGRDRNGFLTWAGKPVR